MFLHLHVELSAADMHHVRVTSTEQYRQKILSTFAGLLQVISEIKTYCPINPISAGLIIE